MIEKEKEILQHLNKTEKILRNYSSCKWNFIELKTLKENLEKTIKKFFQCVFNKKKDYLEIICF